MKCYGIIGYPLTHSFSRQYFTEKFRQEGIADCSYETYPLKNIGDLPALLQQNPQLLGLNITIPYKRSVIQFLQDIEHLPAGLPACNCIKIIDGKTVGYNTDVTGFERSVEPMLTDKHIHALILGNGGAAEAVKFVLQKLNISYSIVGRTVKEGIKFTYADLDEKVINEHLLIINTTPLGTFPAIDECPDIPYQFLGSQHLLYDLVYNPSRTLFLQKGKEQGAIIKNGYEMLLIQAEESWRIWNGELRVQQDF